ncbi:MAG: hypothetical protein KC478_08735, partial [Bacteriovoracaceae bacterium]|nr:hypothetical protein [Bacteriovoracaceae bacterium]
GAILNCTGASTLSTADMCEMMNMGFDSATGRCEPRNTCEVLGTFTTLSCMPAGFACQWSTPSADSLNPLTGGRNCPTGSTPSVTSQFSHNVDVATGKKSTQTVTNTELYYVCLKCL